MISLNDIKSALETNNNAAATKTERKPSELWINVGLKLKITDKETGEAREMFLSLPYNLDLTNMPYRKVGTKESAFNQMVSDQNRLLDMLREKGMSLKAGEAIDVDTLSCQLQRVSTEKYNPTSSLLDNITL